MISTTLLICTGVAGGAIVVALMTRKLRRRLRATASAENANWRDMTFAGMLLNLAAAVGIARAQAEQSSGGNPDGGHGWHGSHLDHGASGGFSDGGGFSGGDSGGGGL
jgi:uncharacterized membrane protein